MLGNVLFEKNYKQYFTWGPTVEESSSNAFLAIFFKTPFSPMIVSLTICPFGNIVMIILAPSTASSAEEQGVAPVKIIKIRVVRVNQ